MTNTRRCTVLTFASLAILSACEPPPADIDPIDLRNGEWLIEVTDASMTGPCEDMDLAEVIGSQLEALLSIDAGGYATAKLDGVTMEGSYEENVLTVTGDLLVILDDNEDVEPGDGATATLTATAIDSTRWQGSLVLDYVLPDFQCVIETTVEGNFAE